MQSLWASIAVASALAIVAGTVYLIRGELRAYRLRQIKERLEDATPRPRGSYGRFNQDQMLRNRSDRWD